MTEKWKTRKVERTGHKSRNETRRKIINKAIKVGRKED